MQPHIGEGPYAYVHIDEQCPVSHPSDRNFADFVIKDESGNALLIPWLSHRFDADSSTRQCKDNANE